MNLMTCSNITILLLQWQIIYLIILIFKFSLNMKFMKMMLLFQPLHILFFAVTGWPVAHIAQMCAAWNIVLVSFCRYIAVCKPLETNKYSSIATIHRSFVTVVACIIVFCLPRFFRFSIKMVPDGSKLRIVPAAYNKSMGYFVYDVSQWVSQIFLFSLVMQRK